MGGELVPVQSPVVRILKALLGFGGGRHESIKWDTLGRCSAALCRDCGREIGVTGPTGREGVLTRHGPIDRPCGGTGGRTTFPVIGPRNANAAYAAKNAAIAGRRRPRRKR